MATCINYAWYIGKMGIFQYAYPCNDIGDFELSLENYHSFSLKIKVVSTDYEVVVKPLMIWIWENPVICFSYGQAIFK